MTPESIFLQIAEVLAPGVSDLVAAIENYSDESVRDDIMCVGGYAFSKLKRTQFDKSWRAFLRGHGLPFFRMSACRPGTRPFHEKSAEQCDQIARQAIGLIKDYAAVGMAIAMSKSEFEARKTPAWRFTTPYELCVWTQLVNFRRWAKQTGRPGKIAYFFESGFIDQSKADALMAELFRNSRLNEFFRYGGHAFVPKEHNPAAQAADMLAWLCRKEYERRRNNELRLPRADFVSLTKTRTALMLINGNDLDELALTIKAVLGESAPRKK